MPSDKDRLVLSPELHARLERLSVETLVAVLDAYHEGRLRGRRDVTGEPDSHRRGWRTAREQLRARLDTQLETLRAELETQRRELTHDEVAWRSFEARFAGAHPSPLAAAHLSGAEDMLSRLRHRLEEVYAQGRAL